jgi:hypothetical protein
MQASEHADQAALLQYYRERVDAFDGDRAEFSKIVQDLSVSQFLAAVDSQMQIGSVGISTAGHCGASSSEVV